MDIEQKTEADGSFSVPVKYVETLTYLTKWERDKNRTYSKLRSLMKDAKAPSRGYPRFGVAVRDEGAKAPLPVS